MLQIFTIILLKNYIIMLIIMLKIYWLFLLFSTLLENFYNFFFTFAIKKFKYIL